jgi:hypothetical protein
MPRPLRHPVLHRLGVRPSVRHPFLEGLVDLVVPACRLPSGRSGRVEPRRVALVDLVLLALTGCLVDLQEPRLVDRLARSVDHRATRLASGLRTHRPATSPSWGLSVPMEDLASRPEGHLARLEAHLVRSGDRLEARLERPGGRPLLPWRRHRRTSHHPLAQPPRPVLLWNHHYRRAARSMY